MKKVNQHHVDDGLLRDKTAILLEKLNDIPTLPVIALQVNGLLNYQGNWIQQINMMPNLPKVK